MRNILCRDKALQALVARLERQNALTKPAAYGTVVERENALASIVSGALHEIYAGSPADAVAVSAFSLGLAIRLARGRPIVWVLHDQMKRETGSPHGPGLQEMGVSLCDLLLVLGRDVQTLLTVSEDVARSPAVGAVVLSVWGEAKAISLTAGRRLALAAETGGATIFLARAGAEPCPSAAETRWSVCASASTPLEGGAPGRPSFSATQLRSRRGGTTGKWIMEWDREQRAFRESTPLSGSLVPVVTQRPAAAAETATGRRTKPVRAA